MIQTNQRPSVSGNERVLRIPGGKTKSTLNIGTWNVTSLFESGKLANVVQEMQRLKIHILGISETWWPDQGTCHVKGAKFYFSGNNTTRHRNGVGFIVAEHLINNIEEFVPHSDRIALLRINTKPVKMNIIQVYAPTAEKPDEEVEELYEQLTHLMKQTKPHEINLIIGDFNAKVGSGKVDKIVGSFGLGVRNERGDRLVQFCQEQNLRITNTTFCLPPRRLYTWISPQDRDGNIVRNQIDYILINNRFSTSVRKVSTYPGADVPSNHNLLLAKIKIKLARARRSNQQPRLDLEQLKNNETKARLSNEINNKLRAVDSDGDIWHQTKVILTETSRNILGNKEYVAKEEWMTTEILEMMEERRSFKNKNNEEYDRVKHEIRRKIRRAKSAWLNRECDEIERLQQLHDDFNLHKKIKEVSGVYKKSTCTSLKDDSNNYAIQTEDKLKVWESYITKLFSDTNRSYYHIEPQTQPSETPITRDEIKAAIKSSKNNKSPGPDDIPSEIIKLVDDENLKLLEQLFNKIYNSGIFPEDWLKSTFIALPKKSNAKTCNDYRLISLMSHTLKIFLKIIHNRIYSKCEEHMGTTQFGFKKATGTREALFSLQVLVQNCRDVQKDVFLSFIDYEKAFDKVKHEKLISILYQMGIDENIIRCIKNLYWQQSANVKVDKNLTNSIQIQQGVRQGCILSPMLFNLYAEAIFRESIADLDVGVKVNGSFINNIRYADDTVLIADNLSDLQHLVDKINCYSNHFGLTVNISKTKFMIVSRKKTLYTSASITINNLPIERVSKFKYLGTWLNEDWDCSPEIKCRIEMARSAFLKYKKLFCCRDLNITLRIRFMKCYVWSVLLYGMEAWTLKQNDINKLEAFEMWVYRKMLKISWTDHVSNEDVLNRIGANRELLKRIKRQKTSYFGHIMRGNKYELLQLIIQGKIEGRRGIGRKQKSWLRNIREWTGVSNIGELMHTASDRISHQQLIDSIT